VQGLVSIKNADQIDICAVQGLEKASKEAVSFAATLGVQNGKTGAVSAPRSQTPLGQAAGI
jgi:hypothetical protein